MFAPPLPTSTSFGKSKFSHIKVMYTRHPIIRSCNNRLALQLEDNDNGHALINGSNTEIGSSSTASLSKVLPQLYILTNHTNRLKSQLPLNRSRSTRRPTQKEPEENDKESNEKRGKKRKEPEDEVPDNDGRARAEVIDNARKEKERKERADREKREREKRKKIRTPTRQGHVPPAPTSSPASFVTPVSATLSAPTTPSLKIRLPRLSNVNLHPSSPAISTPMPGINLATPTRR